MIGDGADSPDLEGNSDRIFEQLDVPNWSKTPKHEGLYVPFAGVDFRFTASVFLLNSIILRSFSRLSSSAAISTLSSVGIFVILACNFSTSSIIESGPVSESRETFLEGGFVDL